MFSSSGKIPICIHTCPTLIDKICYNVVGITQCMSYGTHQLDACSQFFIVFVMFVLFSGHYQWVLESSNPLVQPSSSFPWERNVGGSGQRFRCSGSNEIPGGTGQRRQVRVDFSYVIHSSFCLSQLYFVFRLCLYVLSFHPSVLFYYIWHEIFRLKKNNLLLL